MERFQIFFTFFIFISAEVKAQASASADITATIVSPISIAKVPGKDLSFGSIAPSHAAGLVILSANGSRSAQGGAALPSNGGNITPAEFKVTGEGSYSFSIGLPTTPVIMINSGNSETMIVEGFTSSPENTGTLSGGERIVKVGATLKINPNQARGQYYSATPFTVTVNYN